MIMKTKINTLFLISIFLLSLVSCDDITSDKNDIGGTQSEFGEIGHEIDFGPIQGISSPEVYVSDLEDGVSTYTCSANVTNSTYIDLLELVPEALIPGSVSITGNTVEANINMKVTDKGAQLIFNSGEKLTLINYDAKVGDKYSVKVDGTTLANEVTEKSSEDDFYWGGMYIKVIKVKAKSTVPGISDVILIYNHKFGLVGADVYFEDGSVKYIGIFC